MQQTSCRSDIAGGISPHYQNRSMLYVCVCVFPHHPTQMCKLKVKSLGHNLDLRCKDNT